MLVSHFGAFLTRTPVLLLSLRLKLGQQGLRAPLHDVLSGFTLRGQLAQTGDFLPQLV